MPSNILLTGGLGFIGSSVLDALLRNTDSVIYLMDNKSINRELETSLSINLLNPRVVWIPIDEIVAPSLIVKIDFDSFIHLGAIASTARDIPLGNLLYNNAYLSELIFKFAAQRGIYTVYASSAAVYGNTQSLLNNGYMNPSNTYGISKAMTENAAERHLPLISTGLRLFNVYGEGEFHKKSMASLPLNLFKEAKEFSTLTVFTEPDADSSKVTEVSRDYISVNSVGNLILKLITLKPKVGIIDVGSGKSISTLQLVLMVQEFFPDAVVVEEKFSGNWNTYQKYTKANLEWVEKLGIDWKPEMPEHGILKYLNFLNLSFK